MVRGASRQLRRWGRPTGVCRLSRHTRNIRFVRSNTPSAPFVSRASGFSCPDAGLRSEGWREVTTSSEGRVAGFQSVRRHLPPCAVQPRCPASGFRGRAKRPPQHIPRFPKCPTEESRFHFSVPQGLFCGAVFAENKRSILLEWMVLFCERIVYNGSVRKGRRRNEYVA